MLSQISNLLPSFVWTLCGGALLTVGDITLRSWFQFHSPYGFGAAFVLYVMGLSCMMLSFFEQNIAVASVAAIVLNTVAYICVAYLWYGDTLSVWQGIAIFLGLVAVAILELA